MARPTQLVLLFVTLGVVHSSQGHARSFTRCQLSRELLRYNFPRSMIPNWVCLIEHASGRTTDKVTNHNNSYTSYGLFQATVMGTELFSRDPVVRDWICERKFAEYVDRVGLQPGYKTYKLRDDTLRSPPMGYGPRLRASWMHAHTVEFELSPNGLVSVAANLPDIVALWPLATSPGTEKINNKDWCKKGRKGGHCNIKCEDLLNEDLADDVRCAKRIYDRVGFKAWPTSFSYCKENSLPDLSRC